MRHTKSTLATMMAAVILSGLMVSTASAAVRDSYRMSDDSAGNFYRWSDISALTHGFAAADEGNTLQSGRLDGFYKWSDRNFKQGRVSSDRKPVGKSAQSFYKWSDINSVTLN